MRAMRNYVARKYCGGCERVLTQCAGYFEIYLCK